MGDTARRVQAGIQPSEPAGSGPFQDG